MSRLWWYSTGHVIHDAVSTWKIWQVSLLSLLPVQDITMMSHKDVYIAWFSPWMFSPCWNCVRSRQHQKNNNNNLVRFLYTSSARCVQINTLWSGVCLLMKLGLVRLVISLRAKETLLHTLPVEESSRWFPWANEECISRTYKTDSFTPVKWPRPWFVCSSSKEQTAFWRLVTEVVSRRTMEGAYPTTNSRPLALTFHTGARWLLIRRLFRQRCALAAACWMAETSPCLSLSRAPSTMQCGRSWPDSSSHCVNWSRM